MGFKLEHNDNDQKQASGGLSNLLQKEIHLFGRSFSNKKKEDFYTELGVLLKAGINLKEALGLILEGQKKEKQRQFIENIVDSLISGKNLSETIEGNTDFSEYEFYSLKIGEESGTLTDIVTELGLFFSRKNEQFRNLINALTYPIIILITALLVIIFMLRLVVPMFEDIFKQNGVDLPWITKLIVAASNFIKDYGWIIFSVILISLVFRKLVFGHPWFQKKKDYALLRIPYVGSFIKAVYLSQFTRALSLLTASKVPMLTGIGLASKMIKFTPLKQALDEVASKILRGESLSTALKQNKLFDSKMVSLVKVAEETNQTEFIFQRLNQQYSIEVQQKSKLLSTLLEPFIILIVGVFVGVILVAMYLPMFKLGSVLG
ncbi:type II secretion system F family protein [Croceitalea sp. MTPC5]|uniref:type II secretion system F family protein n=1 Tax=Croceitalea sp. MTPC5 TaxID=3056565 RepID=UPI002B392673|nr:type II secretion system F family protein [Croceitalea sp. MTPC5]